MRKWLRKILLALLLTLLVLFTSVNAGLYFFGDKIAALAVSRMNKHLSTPVKVGKINVVFWSTFPYVSLHLSDVVIKESDSLTGQPVLQCADLRVSFRVSDIAAGNYIIRAIELEDAHLNFADKGKRRNYEIVRADTAATAESHSGIDLRKVVLKNTRFRYRELREHHDIHIDISTLKGKGEFMESDFTAMLGLEGLCRQLTFNGLAYTAMKNLKLDAELSVKNGTQMAINNGQLLLGNNRFVLSGGINNKETTTELDLHIQGKNTTLHGLLGLIPGAWTESLQAYNSDGDIRFEAAIKGLAGAGNIPEIKAKVQVENGVMSPPGNAVSLRNIKAVAALANRKTEKEIFDLDIAPMSLSLGDGQISGSLRLLNLSDPHLEAGISGNLALDDIRKIAGQEKVRAGGSVSANVHVKGKASLLEKDPQAVSTSGSVTFAGVHWQDDARSMDIRNTNGKCVLNAEGLTLQEIKTTVSGQPIMFTGAIPGFWPWLFGKQKKIEVNGSLETPHLDLAPFAVSNSGSSSGSDANVFSDNVELDLSLKIGKLIYRRFEATDLHGVTAYRHGNLSLSNLAMKTMGGFVNLRGVFKQDKTGYVCRGSFNGENINISKLFYAFEDFGQADLTHRHLEGIAGFSGEMVIPFNQKLEVKERELYTYADVEITGGMLRNYEPLQSLSAFVKVDELREIRFNNLKNQIEVSNASIKIPNMLISNSAMNVELSGIHTFDNHMNYNFRIRVSDLLAAKYGFRKSNSDGRYEDHGQKGMSMYVRMEGFPDNLKISYDKQAVKTKINEGVKQEKTEFRQMIKDEFSRKNKPDDPRKPNAQPAQKGEVVEWEDD